MMLAINDIFHNRYELLQNIGSGGFTEVWKALDQMSNMIVAIKIFRKQDQSGIELSREEYQKTFGLSHPNIIFPFHFDVADGRPYLVMKYVKGGTLSDRIGLIGLQEIKTFIDQIGDALRYIHRLSTPMIHGDIKPDNILIDGSGHFYLIDFGISVKLKQKFTETMPMVEELSSAKGVTPMAYRAPENFKYKNWEATGNSVKSDIWSVGVTLYNCLYNQLPFNGEGGLGQLVMMKSGNYSIEELLEFPETETLKQVNHLITNCLLLDPSTRIDSLFLADVEPAQEMVPETKRVVVDYAKTKKKEKNVNKYLIWLLLSIVVIAIVVGILVKKNNNFEDFSTEEYVHDPNEMIIISDDTLKRLAQIETPIEAPISIDQQNIDQNYTEMDQPSTTSSNKTLFNTPKYSPPEVQNSKSETKKTLTQNSPLLQDENPIPKDEVAEKTDDKNESVHAEVLSKTPVSKEKISIEIKQNIEVPIKLESEIESLFRNATKNSKIVFVVHKDVEANGHVFLNKGTKVNADILKITKNTIKLTIKEITSNGGTKIVLNNGELELKKETPKGADAQVFTNKYQKVLILK